MIRSYCRSNCINEPVISSHCLKLGPWFHALLIMTICPFKCCLLFSNHGTKNIHKNTYHCSMNQNVIINFIFCILLDLFRKYLLVDPVFKEESIMEGNMVISMNSHRELCTVQMTGGMLLLKDQVSTLCFLANHSFTKTFNYQILRCS